MATQTDEKEAVTAKKVDFIEAETLCVLCNTKLEIKVESYLEDNFIKEEAYCPHCQIKTRQKNHRMH